MAKILTTKGSSASLEDILLKAEKEVFLISYSYIISDSFLKTFKRITEKGVVVRMVYGNYIKTDDDVLFESLPNIEILHFPNLHAKIFANESKCIIGSMNFSKASEINNTELGVLLSASSDSEAYREAVDHCKFIIKEANIEKSISPKERFISRTTTNTLVNKRPSFIPLGYCIRTGTRIPLNHERPLSHEAYSVWSQYGDVNYSENYDHFTGELSKGLTSMAIPILQKNWNRYLKAIGEI